MAVQATWLRIPMKYMTVRTVVVRQSEWIIPTVEALVRNVHEPSGNTINTQGQQTRNIGPVRVVRPAVT